MFSTSGFWEQECYSCIVRNAINSLWQHYHWEWSNTGKDTEMGCVKKINKRGLHPPSYIIWNTADWCMFVPRWQIFTPPHVWDSEYIFQWDNHASTSAPSTTHTLSNILYTHIHIQGAEKHTQEAKKPEHVRVVQTGVVFQSMRDAGKMQTQMHANKNTVYTELLKIPTNLDTTAISLVIKVGLETITGSEICTEMAEMH